MSAGKRNDVEPTRPALDRGLDSPPLVVPPPPPGEGDPLGPAKGIMNGILYSIPIWFLIGMVAYLLWKVAQ